MIIMMLVSGLLSIVVIGVLFANMMNYVYRVNAADQAVKICRMNVNAAARNIREMALNEDVSTYESYEQTVEKPACRGWLPAGDYETDRSCSG